MRPKGVGFLYVRRDRQEGIQPPVISHGYNTPRPGHSRFHDLFDWPGTADPSPWLCLAAAIGFVDTLMDGGLPALMRRNHELAVQARRMLCERLGVTPLCPEEMLGSMAAVRLPDDPPGPPAADAAPDHRIASTRFCTASMASKCRSIIGPPRRTRFCGFRPRLTTVSRNMSNWPTRLRNYCASSTRKLTTEDRSRHAPCAVRTLRHTECAYYVKPALKTISFMVCVFCGEFLPSSIVPCPSPMITGSSVSRGMTTSTC